MIFMGRLRLLVSISLLSIVLITGLALAFLGSTSRRGTSHSGDHRVWPVEMKSWKALRSEDPTLVAYPQALAKTCLDSFPSRVASTLHLLRIWGAGDGCRRLALNTLLDNDEFITEYHSKNPWIMATRYGARFAEYDPQEGKKDRSYEAHHGITLCVLGEIGVPLTEKIRTNEGTSDLKHVLDDLTATFSFDMELDFVAVALALYLPPQSRWKNKLDEEYSFEMLVSKLLERSLGSGACGGTHTLYALAVILQADEQYPVLSGPVRSKAANYLRVARDRLMHAQMPDGSWDLHWADGLPEKERISSREANARQKQLANQKIHMTGHILELMAIVPADSRLPDQVLAKSAAQICEAVANRDRSEIIRDACTFTHGIRGIQILMGSTPKDGCCGPSGNSAIRSDQK